MRRAVSSWSRRSQRRTPYPRRNAERDVSTIAVDQKKPKPAWNGITVTWLVTGGGNGGNGNDLVVGTPSVDNLRGMNGNDCLPGGDGNDTLRGDSGIDVCIGGPGTDTFHVSCEAQLQ